MWNDNISSFYCNNSPRLNWHQKRKGESLMDMMPPLKMHINEEKMVTQLNGIHLSSTYTPHGSSSNLTATDSPFFDNVLIDNVEANKVESLPSLQLCDELKSQFNSKNFPRFSSSVPTSILDKFNKGCTALVLWQPPMGSIARTLSCSEREGPEDVEAAGSGAENSRPEIVDVEMAEDDDDNNNSLRVDPPAIF